MARTSIATDNFNRATLDANWSQMNSDNGSIAISGSTVAYGTSAATGSASYHDGPSARWVGAGTFTNDHYSKIAVAGLSTLAEQYHCGVVCRASADTNGTRDYFGAIVCAMAASGGTQKVILFKVVNGTLTEISNQNVTYTNGDTISLEVSGASPSISLTVYKNDVAIGGNMTQTGISGPDTGAPGVHIAGGSGTLTGDSWEAGSITASAVSIKLGLLQGVG